MWHAFLLGFVHFVHSVKRWQNLSIFHKYNSKNSNRPYKNIYTYMLKKKNTILQFELLNFGKKLTLGVHFSEARQFSPILVKNTKVTHLEEYIPKKIE